MTHESVSRPTIVIDLRRNRFRINAKTLRSLGNPASILLLVNPASRTVAIECGDHSGLCAHYLLQTQVADRRHLELYSKPLVKSLLGLSDCWQDNHVYRLYGENIPDKRMICFDITKSAEIHNGKRSNYERA